MSNLLTRALTGALFVIIMIAAIVFGPYTLQILFLIVSCAALLEFYKLIEGDVQPQIFPGLITGILVFSHITFLSGQDKDFIYVVYAAIALLFIIELYRKKKNPFANIGFTLLGIIYIVIPFALLVNLSFRNGGYFYALPLGFFILLWCSDTFAYLAGMTFGKHKLFERISPKKSWEGSIGGALTSLVAAYILSRTIGYFGLRDWIVISLIIVIAGTFGDLTESMLKRSLDKKDSGNILPGHGGLLDRFDGLFLAVPFIALYLRAIRYFFI